MRYVFIVLSIFLLLVALGWALMTVSKFQPQPDRWVCAKTERQRVLIIDPVSGAQQVLMDSCVEWKAKP